MDDIFTDDQLNIGKVLILGSGHGFKLSEIKALTKAAKVRKLKWTGNYDDVDTFLLSAMHKTINALDIDGFIGCDVYRVEGDEATTSMLILKSLVMCMPVDLDCKNLKKLHNACYTKQCIDRAKRGVMNAIDSHYDLSAVLTKQKIKNGITKKTISFDKLIQGYADAELKATIGKIEEVMQNTW